MGGRLRGWGRWLTRPTFHTCWTWALAASRQAGSPAVFHTNSSVLPLLLGADGFSLSTAHLITRPPGPCLLPVPQAEQALRTFNNSLPAAAAWLLTAGFIGGEEDAPAASPPPAEQAPEAAGAAAADEARSGRPASIGSSRGDEPQTQEEPSAAGWAPQVGQPASASGSDSEGDDPALLQRSSGGSSVDDRDGGQPPAGQQQQHLEAQAGRPGPLLESEAEEEGGEEAPPLLAADDDTAA